MNQQADAFIDLAISAFQRSVRDHDGALRNVQLATVSAEGRPRIRTVVVRDFCRSEARAEIYSDARAGKTHDIARGGGISFLAWSSSEHLQLRFEGAARLYARDALARARWDALSPGARKAYGLSNYPGAAIADPEEQSLLSPEEQFEQFVVIGLSLFSVDILHLEPEGRQKRATARFASSQIKGEWIGP